MPEKPLSVLQINTLDRLGGAAHVMWNLHRAYKKRGINSWLAVKSKSSDDPQVMEFSRFDPAWESAILKMAGKLLDSCNRIPLSGKFSAMIRWTVSPGRMWAKRRGYEIFSSRATCRLARELIGAVDIVHCHNLHGDYFDLRILPQLSKSVPVVISLHDAWLLGGHCAHSFDCERWKSGCGECPYMEVPPAIRQDATAHNWRQKAKLYAGSRLYVAAPCQWLMNKVNQSMLTRGVLDSRIIPNGVDLSIFRPRDRDQARKALNITQYSKVLLFIAVGARQNIWKDYTTIQRALMKVAERLKDEQVLFLALGEEAPPERLFSTKINFISHQNDPAIVACYYQAADIYLHASRADTFPNTILESLACGTPVVATAVGGIPDQIQAMEQHDFNSEGVSSKGSSADDATGILVHPRDADAMANAVVLLLRNPELLLRMGENAALNARGRFNLDGQVDKYLAWYEEILADWHGPKRERQH